MAFAKLDRTIKGGARRASERAARRRGCGARGALPGSTTRAWKCASWRAAGADRKKAREQRGGESAGRGTTIAWDRGRGTERGKRGGEAGRRGGGKGASREASREKAGREEGNQAGRETGARQAGRQRSTQGDEHPNCNCNCNSRCLGEAVQRRAAGRAAGRPGGLTQPSLAGSWAELGKNKLGQSCAKLRQSFAS